jgi:hypothetical protein
MSLIRFLSSGGRGLTKGAPPLGRYRLPDGRLIPDFGGGKNPFTSKVLPVREEDSSSATGVTARAALTQAVPPSPVSLNPGKPVAGLLAVLWRRARGLSARVEPATHRVLQAVKGLVSALVAKLRRRQARSPLATSTRPQVAGPVQGELSLEKVRVVRNDLTDTDYEVVCAETVTASPLKKVPATVSLSPQPRTLGRLAERLFSQKSH